MKRFQLSTLIAAVAAIFVMSAGCEKGEKAGAEDNPTAEGGEASGDNSGAARTGSGSAAAGGPTVKLLEPGAEPRRELRYKLTAGSNEAMVMSMEMAMATKAPGANTPRMKLPVMDMVMTMSIAEKVGADKARYTFEMSGSKVHPGEGAMA
ncbi:MAG: hypothetical protein AAGC55_00620, partial [Myxococcota bacterium]